MSYAPLTRHPMQLADIPVAWKMIADLLGVETGICLPNAVENDRPTASQSANIDNDTFNPFI
ncbi:MAG: hypothetical protein WCJ35_00635 [Planctomycetota bacterium]